MPTRDIVCLNCGFAGVLDIHHKKDATMKDGLFKHLGHNPYSGDLHYQCPACDIVLLVDPMAVREKIASKGSPASSAFGDLESPYVGNPKRRANHRPQPL